MDRSTQTSPFPVLLLNKEDGPIIHTFPNLVHPDTSRASPQKSVSARLPKQALDGAIRLKQTMAPASQSARNATTGGGRGKRSWDGWVQRSFVDDMLQTHMKGKQAAVTTTGAAGPSPSLPRGYTSPPGRLFPKEKTAMTVGEQEIVSGIFNNRGDIPSASCSQYTLVSDKPLTHKDAWLVKCAATGGGGQSTHLYRMADQMKSKQKSRPASQQDTSTSGKLLPASTRGGGLRNTLTASELDISKIIRDIATPSSSRSKNGSTKMPFLNSSGGSGGVGQPYNFPKRSTPRTKTLQKYREHREKAASNEKIFTAVGYVDSKHPSADLLSRFQLTEYSKNRLIAYTKLDSSRSKLTIRDIVRCQEECMAAAAADDETMWEDEEVTEAESRLDIPHPNTPTTLPGIEKNPNGFVFVDIG